MSGDNIVLSLENITRHFRIGGIGTRYKKTVLKDVNLEIEKGKIISITGKSGAGKTTLLNIVSGLIKPSRGKVFWKGRRIFYFLDIMPSRIRNVSIGYVFQSFRLIPDETAMSNALMPLKISGWIGREKKDYVNSLFKDLDIWDLRNMKASLLSGGQKQKVAIVRALANNPELILADEPTANLDFINAREICSIFSNLAAAGISILAVTHHENMESISDKIYLLEEGKLGDCIKC